MDISQKKENLQTQIGELEAQLSVLKNKLNEVEKVEQHQAIDELDVHLSDFDSLLNNIILFTKTCRDEIAQKKS
ncbi:hypothetical protein J3998_10145 [Thiomicrorhabdus sp. 6S2-11]|uniref:Uncharacterized protein n=1 Tax=Thiomicrorhabdus marina TaxID=2818442 RepID=A0ABS3Q6N6_9GAMM|nr:hypothetical protein [Thiomicrorhabdus marina]MBO1927936.1 hypothetical protein [Thiomicrorhabdus marina]